MFWNWSHFFLHQIWLLAILEFQAREDRKQSLVRRSITQSPLLPPACERGQTWWRMEEVEETVWSSWPCPGLSRVGSGLETSHYARCPDHWLWPAPSCSSPPPSPPPSSASLTWRAVRCRCVRRREDTELVSSNTTKVSPGYSHPSFIFLCKSWNIVMKWRSLSLLGKVQQKTSVFKHIFLTKINVGNHLVLNWSLFEKKMLSNCDGYQGARWRAGDAPPTTSCSSPSARTTWWWGRGWPPPGGRGSATAGPSSATLPPLSPPPRSSSPCSSF